MNKKNTELVHSSSAEYLTYIAANGTSPDSIEIRYENENIWLSQKMMAELYDVTISAINQHIKKVLEDGELSEDSTIKKYLIVQNSSFLRKNKVVLWICQKESYLYCK